MSTRLPAPWSRLSRLRLPLSREGAVLTLMALGMMFMGLYKGINLITLLSCMLLVMVGWNYLLARRQLRHVRIQRLPAGPAFARTPWHWSAEISNAGATPVYELRVEPRGADADPGRFIAELKGQASLVVGQTTSFPRRGRARQPAVHLRSGFPFGLVHLRRTADDGAEMVVLPEVGTLHRGTLKALVSARVQRERSTAASARRRPDAQVLFHGLRPYRPGDSLKLIHWRTTARRGELMVREFEDPPADDFCLLLDASRAPGDAAEDPGLERRLRRAATLCWEWSRQHGDQFVLGIAGETASLHAGLTGSAFTLQMLEALALEPGSPTPATQALIDRLQEEPPRVGTVLVLCPAASSLPQQLQQRTHYAVVVLEDDSPEASHLFAAREETPTTRQEYPRS